MKYFIIFFIGFLILIGAIDVYSQTTQTYTSSTTFNVPSDVTSVKVECWGGGGAGGGNSANRSRGGGGGAGGSYAVKVVTVVAGNGYTVTVAGTTAGGYSAGSQGGPSWFGTTSTVYAQGGAGGAAPNGGTAAWRNWFCCQQHRNGCLCRRKWCKR